MKRFFPGVFACLGVVSCGSYTPLRDPGMPVVSSEEPRGPHVRVSYFGNTTLLISDGTTRLLVDGFFSRPGALKTLFGKIAPEPCVIDREMELGGIKSVDAILVGHAHHDHALDAPLVAEKTGATVIGSESYKFIHEGAGGKMDGKHLKILRKDRESFPFGEFTVTFVKSDHVAPGSFLQRAVEGDIEQPVKTPARYSDFKCGTVYAIHIAHPQGNIAITTTAGAEPGQYQGLRADVLFLGVGTLVKQCPEAQETYWNETVGTLDPDLLVPVHWDSFTRKLDRGLAPPLRIVDDVKGCMTWIKTKRTGRSLGVMDLRNSIYLQDGRVK